MREFAALIWFLLPIIGNHVIFAGTSKVVYDALGNTIWTVIYFLYIMGTDTYVFHGRKLVDPARKKATLIVALLFLICSLNLPTVFAAILSGEIFAKITYNVALMIGSAAHYVAAGLVVGLTPRNVSEQCQKIATRSNIVKVALAILLRTLFQFA